MAGTSRFDQGLGLRVAAPDERRALAVGVLGAFQVHRAGVQLPLAAVKQQMVLASLALSAGEVVSRWALIDELWDALPPKSSLNTLQTYVSRLRRLLTTDDAAGGLLRTHPDGYELAIDPDAVDALRFERAVAQARTARVRDPVAGHELLVGALSLWRGPVLAGLTPGPVLRPRVEQLEELLRTATVERLELDVALGRHAEVVGELTALVAEQPLWERCSGLLMTALYRSGRQAEALEVYRSLRAALVTELGVEPGPDVAALHTAVLEHDPDLAVAPGPLAAEAVAARAGGRRAGHIPRPVTALIGRDSAVVQVCERIAATRLVTLTGTGGGGKTRLAIAAAARLHDRFPQGAYFVELGDLDEPELVAKVVSVALGLSERPDRSISDGLVEELRADRALLVLDNCEHVVDAVAELADRLLTACPDLRVLATSREVLQVAGEAVMPVAPLAVPTPAEHTAAAVMLAPAARLFAARATDASAGFAVTDGNAPAVARICRTLDGVPLALELAASRLAVIDADEIAERLEDRFGLLVVGSCSATTRHRTLRATVEWSHDSLGSPEQELFARLSVFAGPFSLDAVETVCGPLVADTPLLDSLGQLVGKSLVLAEAGPTGVRYRLLETLRAYARERLEASGEHDQRRRRHAAWCLAVVGGAQTGLRGLEQGAWRRRVDDQQDNLRAALRWALAEREAATAVALATSLWWFWYRSGQVREGRLWAERALDVAGEGATVPVRERAGLLQRAAHLSWALNDVATAESQAAAALALHTQTGDDHGIGESSAVLGLTARQRGDVPGAVARLGASLAAHRRAGDPWSIATAAMLLGDLRLELGELEEAGALLVESLERFTASGDPFGIGWARCGAGKLATARAEYATAVDHFAASLSLSQHIGHRTGVGLSLIGLAHTAVRTGRPLRAAQLFAAAAAVADAVGVPLHLHYGASYDQALADTRAYLGASRYERAWTQGQAMTAEEAVAYALTGATAG